ncbi:carbon starvation protein A [bacterium]|nr:carbon starvation protein A [bacterium]
MSSALIAVGGACWLVIAYFWYGRFLEKNIVKPDFSKATPAHTHFDGIDFQPTRPEILFGHHFSSIAGAGPIVGPVAAALAFGWGAGLLWILIGVVFIGAVHDYLALTISIHNNGRSVSDTTRQLLNTRSWFMFQLFVWFTLVLVIAVFINVAAKSFVANPQIVLPAFMLIPIAMLFGMFVYRWRVPVWLGTVVALALLTLSIYLGTLLPINMPGNSETVLHIWYLVLACYCWLASVLPVWLLLQPRDYIANWVLIIGMLLGFMGLVISNYPINAPAFIGFYDATNGPLYPMLFILIACGAVSGFHSLVASGTTSKQLDTEKNARLIGYGAMLTEGALALVALLAVTAGLYWKGTAPPGCEHLVFQDITGGPIVAFGTGFGRFVAPFFGLAFGTLIGITMLNTFVITTLDTATRLTRFVTTELTGDSLPALKNRFVASTVAVIPAYLLSISGGWQTLWPLFGASNQMIATLALFVATVYLVGLGRPSLYTLIPAIFMLFTTVSALIWQGYQNIIIKGNLFLGGLCLVLLVLALLVAFDACSILKALKRRPVTET